MSGFEYFSIYLKLGDSLIAHLNMLRDEIQILVSQVRGSESKNVSNNNYSCLGQKNYELK